MKDARSRKVTFCKLTDLEKRGETVGGGRDGTAAGPPDVDRDDSLDTRDSGLLSCAPKKFSTAGQGFAIQFGEPSNGNIVDKRAT